MGVLLLYAAFAFVIAAGGSLAPRLPALTALLVSAVALSVTTAQYAVLAAAPRVEGCVASGTAGHRLVGALAIVAIGLGGSSLGIGIRAGVRGVYRVLTISAGILGVLAAIAAFLAWDLVGLCGS